MLGLFDTKTKNLSRELFRIWSSGDEGKLTNFVQQNEVNSDVISRFLIMVEGFELAGNTTFDKNYLESRIRSYKNI